MYRQIFVLLLFCCESKCSCEVCLISVEQINFRMWIQQYSIKQSLNDLLSMFPNLKMLLVYKKEEKKDFQHENRKTAKFDWSGKRWQVPALVVFCARTHTKEKNISTKLKAITYCLWKWQTRHRTVFCSPNLHLWITYSFSLGVSFITFTVALLMNE